MRLVQYASDAKAYVAIAGGVTVSNFPVEEWVKYASLVISLMVIAEKFPILIVRCKQLRHWTALQVSYIPKNNVRPGLIFVALVSIFAFLLLFVR